MISTATNTVAATWAAGSNDPTSVSVTPDGANVYVVNPSDGNQHGFVEVFATATNTLVTTIEVGNTPYAFGQFIQPAFHLMPVCAI